MRALICGIGGQDGAYLAKLLLDRGYEVIGTSRDAAVATFSNLRRLGIADVVEKVSMAPSDFRSVATVVSRTKPDEIYNLAGQSSVGLSFEQPAETIDSIVIGCLNLLEAVRLCNPDIKFYNAGSGECFGDTGETGAREDTPFRPMSPYAVAKAAAHGLVANYRHAYGLYACTGILFNHESPLRPERFVTQKIVQAARRVACGAQDRLSLGNLNIRRDWGWAPEFVVPMHAMLQQPSASDYVIATGHTMSLEDFVATAFSWYSLDWREYVEVDQALLRPSDIGFGKGDATRAADALHWRPATMGAGVVHALCDAADGMP